MQIPKFPKLPEIPALSKLNVSLQGGSRLAQGFAAFKANPTRLRRVLMISATFLIAIGAGQFMQGAAGSATPKAEAAPMQAAALLATAIPNVQPAEAVRAGEAVAALPIAPKPSNITEQKDHAAVLLPTEPMVAGIDVVSFTPEVGAPTSKPRTASCDAPELRLSEQPNGIIGVNVYAPCMTDTAIMIGQMAASFKVETDLDGHYVGAMPALTQTPVIEVTLPNGVMVSERIILATSINSERISVSWQGAPDITLNAFEYGAEFGGAGHVWDQAPRQPGNALGGYMMRLGDATIPDPAMSEIYVAPSGMVDVEFDIEAQVTEATCGRDLGASLLRVSGKEEAKVESLSIAMPDCDGVGDAIIMPLPDRDLTLAMIR